MGFPDHEQPLVLHTVASHDKLGAVLYQEQDGKKRLIGYGSRTLSPAEKNYYFHSGKLEFLALKWPITEKFWVYLYYAPSFIVYTDNSPLTYVLTSAKLNATGHRWVAEPDRKAQAGHQHQDTTILLRDWSKLSIDQDGVLRQRSGEKSQIILPSLFLRPLGTQPYF